ncbi:MAG: methyltransferase domain-containing protein [Actinomycetota bacterium]
MNAQERWGEQLAAWAIPDPILAAAPEPPWGFPTECFRRRGAVRAKIATPTTRRAREALPNGGVVLDVGVGGGATSLPLAGRAGTIVGVDPQADMLAAFADNAVAAGVAVETVEGRWPEAADRVPVADVVVAGHVLYNTPDLGPFASAMDAHARSRVVVELTRRHPLWWMRDLWRRFHDLDRPSGPSAEDAHAVLRELGYDVSREERTPSVDEGGSGFADRAAAVAMVRRRLCLPAERDDEIADALGDRLRRLDDGWDVGPAERTIVTLWWDPRR